MRISVFSGIRFDGGYRSMSVYEGVLGYGFCFATETVTHRAICATSCLDKDVVMPVVVLDRCPVSTCREL